MAKPLGLNFYQFYFMLLFLITSAGSMKEMKSPTDPKSPTGDQPEEKKSVTWHPNVSTDTKLKKPVTHEELAAVDGNISAVYIIRVIDERAEALNKSKTEAMAQIPDGIAINEELNMKPGEKTKVHAQKLKKAEQGKTKEEKETHELYVKMWKRSNLSDVDMEKLRSGLAGALTKADNYVDYMKTVKKHIITLKSKSPDYKRLYNWIPKIGKKVMSSIFSRGHHADPNTDPHTSDSHAALIETFEKLNEKHVDFLMQIIAEIKLHYWFKKQDRQEFEAIQQNSIKAGYSSPFNLNNEVKSLHKNIEEVLKSPNKNEHKFVTSLLEVAEMAKKDTSKGRNYEYLRKIFNIADAVATFRKSMKIKLPKEIHDEIGQKLEIPAEWLDTMHAQCYPKKTKKGPVILTVEMMSIQVETMFAKTLLVYERLNNFYIIDSIYEMHKGNKKMPDEKAYSLLKNYFREFAIEIQENPKTVSVGASPAADHGHA